MSYKQFEDGKKLYAKDLQEMQDNIAKAIADKQPKGDYATQADITTAVNKIKIPAVPTKISELTNDAGYLTEHQSLVDYAKKTDIPSIDGLASEDFVNTKIQEVATVKKESFVAIGTPQIYVVKDSELSGDAPEQFANVEAIYAAFDALAEQYPNMFVKQESIGKDASGTYDINYYCLGQVNPKITNDRTGNATNQWSDTQYPRRRIYINGNIHSWVERHCCFGLYCFVKELLESTEPWALYIKNNVLLDIVPQPNPWGYDNKTNVNANNKNLNRFYINNLQPENTCITTLIESLIPKGLIGIIDLHNTNDGTPGYTIGRPSQLYWEQLCRISAQIESISHDSYKTLLGTNKASFYHLWNYDAHTEVRGLLNDYADSKDLLCYTSEVGNNDANGPLFKYGSAITKMHIINVINALCDLTDSFVATRSNDNPNTQKDITDLFAFTNGAAIETYTGNGNQGQTYSTALFKYSDYVDVSTIPNFYMSFVTWRSGAGKQATLGYALYDENKKFVSGRAFDLADASLGNSAGTAYIEHVIITDPKVKYIRTCYPVDTTKYGEFKAYTQI